MSNPTNKHAHYRNYSYEEDVILDMLLALRLLDVVTDEQVLADTMTHLAWIDCL